MNDRHLPSSKLKLTWLGLASLVASTSYAAGPEGTAGTWRYKDRGVWIQLHPDGRAYQCRIDKDETTTYTAAGTLQGNKLKWEAIWGENEIELVGNTLVVVASGRRLEFGRSERRMDAICKSPLP